jgi:hypothetical protein
MAAPPTFLLFDETGWDRVKFGRNRHPPRQEDQSLLTSAGIQANQAVQSRQVNCERICWAFGKHATLTLPPCSRQIPGASGARAWRLGSQGAAVH